MGDGAHAGLQIALGAYIYNRRKQWKIHVYTELRVKVHEKWYPIPDARIYSLPDFEERYPERPPLLRIEILSHDDRMVDVWAKAKELVENGVRYVWVIDPNTLWCELRTAEGVKSVPENTLRIPDTPIVIPLAEAMEA